MKFSSGVAVKSLLFVLCFFTGLSFAQTDTSTVFYSGFEEGSKDIWDDYDSNSDETNLIMSHPGPFNKPGNHVMRFRVPVGRGGSDLVKVLPSSYDKLYLRWYQMWEPGYDFKARNHGSGLYGGARNTLGMSGNRPNGSNFFISTFEPDNVNFRPFLYTYYRGMYMDCADPNGQCWGDHFPCWIDEGERICEKPEHREKSLPNQLEAGKWYCFEMMLDAGTPAQSDAQADGVLNYWIDGIEYGPWTGLWFRTTSNLKLTILWLSLFHHAEHSIEGILFDEIVVSTKKIGCGEITAIELVIKEKETISISPNPASDFIEISVGVNGLSPLQSDVRIYNVFGQTQTTPSLRDTPPYQGGEKVKIDISRLAQGVYFVRVGDRVSKFVKI